ncbi:anaerobic ribonucleoside-triphosphate reductase activating protein [Terrisporobacter sp.]|uniref:anaerobic ribonucleoside-triphosphate reductase activating protein n=1 Tax=Terrisporobacter sp. TaxID=1965305 RepID=UPI0026262C5A|nr:anaerobic ribonucleoside-triphosphate reductase activating protein [Terrisporobacter sp.]
MKVRLASDIYYDSIVDGPGLRMVIWTQGCIHNCYKCHNPQTHNLDGGTIVDTEYIIERIRKLKLQRGITLSGGEPFLQPKALASISKVAKQNNLDVWAYTGFTFEQLTSSSNPLYLDNMNLLKYVDVLVDGKFIFEEKNIELKFRGSSNQRIINVQESLSSNEIVLKYEFMESDLYIAK